MNRRAFLATAAGCAVLPSTAHTLGCVPDGWEVGMEVNSVTPDGTEEMLWITGIDREAGVTTFDTVRPFSEAATDPHEMGTDG